MIYDNLAIIKKNQEFYLTGIPLLVLPNTKCQEYECRTSELGWNGMSSPDFGFITFPYSILYFIKNRENKLKIFKGGLSGEQSYQDIPIGSSCEANMSKRGNRSLFSGEIGFEFVTNCVRWPFQDFQSRGQKSPYRIRCETSCKVVRRYPYS